MTDEAIVLGFDIGSSAAKVVVATLAGEVLARGSSHQEIDRSRSGRAEQDPNAWWAALVELANMALSSIGRIPHGEMAAVAISGHFPTLVVADDLGRPLAPALLYADTRAERYVDEASDLVGAPLLGDEITPKLLLLRAEQPSAFRRIGRIFNPQDYLVFRLTGAHVLDHYTASRLGGLLDVRGLEWNHGVCAALRLPIRVLPALRRPGDLAGSVTTGASAQTGIPAGTPVITGVGDTLAALLGAGVVRRSEALLYYGTTATADVCTCDIESYLLDPSSVARGAPYTEVAYALLGPALRWAARGFGDEDPGALLEPLDTGAQALGTRVDAPYVLPFFMDRPPSGHSTQQPAIVGLDIGHSRSHLHRALLESFGYVIRSGLEGSGYDVSAMPRFVASGGGAASGPWRQIVSDVLGVEQAWGPGLDGALGDAMLAAWATGRLDTFGNGLAGWQKDVCATVPDSHAVGIHRVRYETWKRLASAVAGAYAPGSSPG